MKLPKPILKLRLKIPLRKVLLIVLAVPGVQIPTVITESARSLAVEITTTTTTITTTTIIITITITGESRGMPTTCVTVSWATVLMARNA